MTLQAGGTSVLTGKQNGSPDAGAKRRATMNMQEIKDIAKRREVATGKLKKSELIRAIQRSEGNYDCFDTGQASRCGQTNCLWSGDCK
jgi:hypothetical protein